MNSVSLRRKARTDFAAITLLSMGAVCFAGCQPCGQCGLSPPNAPSTVSASPRHFSVEGMTCEGCVQTITAALKAIPGVVSAEVSLQDKKATVVADEAQVPSAKIEAAIAAAGYKASLLPVSAAQ